MSALTKKRHTESVTLTITGPAKNKNAVLAFIREQGFIDTSDSLPWREVLGQESPGQILRGFRYREDMTQIQLSKLTGISQHHISEMENNKRTIGKAIAQRLAEALNTDYRMFL